MTLQSFPLYTRLSAPLRHRHQARLLHYFVLFLSALSELPCIPCVYAQSYSNDNLDEASEGDPDVGFMARLMKLCSLPRTNPGNRKEYIRKNGPYTLVMTAMLGAKLPYGNLPRLLMAWMCTEAVRTRNRDLVLGRSLFDFMEKLGMNPVGAGRTRLRDQMHRIFNVAVGLVYEDDQGEASMRGVVTARTELWWDPKRPDEPSLWESKIQLGQELFDEIIRHPVPIDMNTLKALKRSPLGLDLYLWLTYRVFTLKGTIALPWELLYRQLGADPARANDKFVVRNFRKKCLGELKKIHVAWPEFRYATAWGKLIVSPARPQVPPKKGE